MQNEIRNARGLLRRARFLAPSLRRVGGNCPGLGEAAHAEGFACDPVNPDLWIVWMPGGEFSGRLPSGISPRVVLVVGRAVASLPLPVAWSRQPARCSTTLREWVAGWPMGGILKPFLAPDAVGTRSCTVNLPGNFEWVFLADPVAIQPVRHGGLREVLATFLGTGHFPVMPATLASAVLLLPAWVARELLGGGGFCVLAWVVTLLATLSSVALEAWAGRRFLATDPREFVLDEVAGMALTWALLPPTAGGVWILAGFVLFRVFDIFKWGVDWVEKLPVPGRIVWDDLLAGTYAGLLTLGIWGLVR